MDYPDFGLRDQVALVTGASQGIGFGLSKALAHAGAKVAVAARSVADLEIADRRDSRGGRNRPGVFA